MNNAPAIDRDDVLKAIEDEPELPGDMPDEMWDALRGFAYRDDREGMIEALRIAVRHTKKGIRE
jgi:hypothetical protein